MREIKFRAWHKKYKEIFKIACLCPDKVSVHGLPLTGTYDLKDVELMQYTGLKDKNGKEIYEGDIVEHKSKYKHVAGKFEVKYDNLKDFAGFCLHRVGIWEKQYSEDEGWEGILGSQGRLTKELEVIGNIYENPELLINTKS